jgi:formiminoglutamase
MASECRSWTSLADLLTGDAAAPVALLGAPLAERSLTPGRCDLAPRVVRATLARMSVYDVETGVDVSALRVFDAGDLDLKLVDPARAFAPIVERMAPLCKANALTILLGGNNAVTRPAVHAVEATLKGVGLLTLDAHFDLRDTDCGLTNGNPVQALLEDGLPGAHIAQIGLAPFANTRAMHEKAKAAGIHVVPLRECRAQGLANATAAALEMLASRCDRILVDFDIDVIDRARLPGAPGARPGGVAPEDFFEAARAVAAHPKVVAVDLTEFDPSLDVADISALTAARWVGEILAGFTGR